MGRRLDFWPQRDVTPSLRCAYLSAVRLELRWCVNDWRRLQSRFLPGAFEHPPPDASGSPSTFAGQQSKVQYPLVDLCLPLAPFSPLLVAVCRSRFLKHSYTVRSIAPL